MNSITQDILITNTMLENSPTGEVSRNQKRVVEYLLMELVPALLDGNSIIISAELTEPLEFQETDSKKYTITLPYDNFSDNSLLYEVRRFYRQQQELMQNQVRDVISDRDTEVYRWQRVAQKNQEIVKEQRKEIMKLMSELAELKKGADI